MKNLLYFIFFFIFTIFIAVGCNEEVRDIDPFNVNSNNYRDGKFDLNKIQDDGELIVLTMYNPTSFYDFHGENHGYQYKLAEDYANTIGCCIRVVVMTSEKEMMEHLRAGEGDMIVYAMPVVDSLKQHVIYCGEKEITHFVDSITLNKKDSTWHESAWVVRASSKDLAESVNKYLTENEDSFFVIASPPTAVADSFEIPVPGTYKPHVNPRASIMNRDSGIISPYDSLFRKFAPRCGWDWRLLAAQSFQESAFDAQAVSFAGAMGLMQLMPATAKRVGISHTQLFTPSVNIIGAVRLINILNNYYGDIHSKERLNFILAAYNAGEGHIDDARRLAKKMGKNPNVWYQNVDSAVLGLAIDSNYNEPFIKCGYMRGTETYNYVIRIKNRWAEYRSVAK